MAPSNASAAMPMVSESVRCGWMVSPMSAASEPISMASAASAMRSPAFGPTMPRTAQLRIDVDFSDAGLHGGCEVGIGQTRCAVQRLRNASEPRVHLRPRQVDMDRRCREAMDGAHRCGEDIHTGAVHELHRLRWIGELPRRYAGRRIFVARERAELRFDPHPGIVCVGYDRTGECHVFGERQLRTVD